MSIVFTRNRAIPLTGSLVNRFRSTILLDKPETKLEFEKTVSVKASFPGSSEETIKVYVFKAENPEWLINKFFCWIRHVNEYGKPRLLTYTIPGYYPKNDHGIPTTPEEAVKKITKLDKNYTVIKDN
jgi:hypothetical protein